jgi:hypothetical protein
MPGSGNLNITQWRSKMAGTTPLQVAERLKDHSARALLLVNEIRQKQPENEELRLTLGDIEAFAHIGNYYSEKILGACDLAMFDASGDPKQQQSAIKHLTEALEHWKRYAAVATKQYKPALYNRVGFVDLNALVAKVAADIVIAREWKPGTIKTVIQSSGGDKPFQP